MGVGAALGVHLYHADDAHLKAIDVKDLGRHDVQSRLFRWEDVGADITEGGVSHQRRQGAHVELMVAQCRGVEAHFVHQGHHREGGYAKHVVLGVASTVVARREYQQGGVSFAQTVGNGSQLREGLNGGVHVVSCKDMHFALLPVDRAREQNSQTCNE